MFLVSRAFWLIRLSERHWTVMGNTISGQSNKCSSSNRRSSSHISSRTFLESKPQCAACALSRIKLNQSDKLRYGRISVNELTQTKQILIVLKILINSHFISISCANYTSTQQTLSLMQTNGRCVKNGNTFFY